MRGTERVEAEGQCEARLRGELAEGGRPRLSYVWPVQLRVVLFIIWVVPAGRYGRGQGLTGLVGHDAVQRLGGPISFGVAELQAGLATAGDLPRARGGLGRFGVAEGLERGFGREHPGLREGGERVELDAPFLALLFREDG